MKCDNDDRINKKRTTFHDVIAIESASKNRLSYHCRVLVIEVQRGLPMDLQLCV